jgi:hypothetical protein
MECFFKVLLRFFFVFHFKEESSKVHVYFSSLNVRGPKDFKAASERRLIEVLSFLELILRDQKICHNAIDG